MQIGSVAVFVHLLATVALVGYYTVLALIALPVLSAELDRPGALGILASLERRAMPILIASLVAFLATGVYLMTSDTRYTGAGNVTGSWATLLLVKHVVIVAMLFVGSYLDGLIVRSSGAEDTGGHGLPRIVLAARAMALLGAVVLLLTAAAQAA